MVEVEAQITHQEFRCPAGHVFSHNITDDVATKPRGDLVECPECGRFLVVSNENCITVGDVDGELVAVRTPKKKMYDNSQWLKLRRR